MCVKRKKVKVRKFKTNSENVINIWLEKNNKIKILNMVVDRGEITILYVENYYEEESCGICKDLSGEPGKVEFGESNEKENLD